MEPYREIAIPNKTGIKGDKWSNDIDLIMKTISSLFTLALLVSILFGLTLIYGKTEKPLAYMIGVVPAIILSWAVFWFFFNLLIENIESRLKENRLAYRFTHAPNILDEMAKQGWTLDYSNPLYTMMTSNNPFVVHDGINYEILNTYINDKEIIFLIRLNDPEHKEFLRKQARKQEEDTVVTEYKYSHPQATAAQIEAFKEGLKVQREKQTA